MKKLIPILIALLLIGGRSNNNTNSIINNLLTNDELISNTTDVISNKKASAITNLNKVEKVEGNGETWPKEIQDLIDKVLINDKESDTIPNLFIDADCYSGEYYENSNDKIEKSTSIICENSTSFSLLECLKIMKESIIPLQEAKFIIDDSKFAQKAILYASRKIKLNESIIIKMNLKEIDNENSTNNHFYGFEIMFSYLKPLATNGWHCTYKAEWPTDDIIELVGKDIPHPDIDYTNISFYGGFNTLKLINNDSETNYLECYFISLIGTEDSTINSYIQQLETAYWKASYFEGGGYGFNMLNQITIEFFYLDQSGYRGLSLIIYVNNPSYVFTKSESWPEVANYLPAYTQENTTLSYYFAHIENEQIGIVVSGVLNNADELYAKQLTSEGWLITKEIDNDTNKEYYLASRESYGKYKFYISSYPEAGISLYIQSINY